MGRGGKEVRSTAMTLAGQQGVRAGQADTARSATGAQLQGATNDLTGYTPDESKGMTYSPEESGSFGYTPESAAKLESSVVGAAAEPFAGVEQSINRNVARTRNSAGAAGAIAKSALARSGAASNAALDVNNVVEGRRQQVAETVANQRTGVVEKTAQSRMQAQQQKIAALAQAYGIDTNLLQNLLGLNVSTLGVAAGTTQRGPVSLGPLGSYG